MSEAVADIPDPSGCESAEPQALASQITQCFEQTVAAIPSEIYTKLARGESRQLHLLPEIGEIVLRYEGSFYQPRTDDEPQRPSYRFNYLLRMSEAADGQQPLGWWMPLHMVYGPRLVLDAPATTEEFVGSTAEERIRLKALVENLQKSYLGQLAK